MKAGLLQPRFAMARALLVVDENLLNLGPALEAKRFKVLTFKSGTKDEQIIPLLAHRIFVTNNPKDFIEAAAIEEFSIIDTTDAPLDEKLMAEQISRAFITLELKSKQPFLLKLRKSGNPELQLID